MEPVYDLPPIETVMKKDLITMKGTGTVREASKLLREGTFHSLPVVDDDGALLGIVTSTDLIRYLHDQY